MKENSNSIDVVIAWVDGSDPNLKKKRSQFLNREEEQQSPGADATRFHSLDEVKYCVLSILKFAPFVRKLFIVTDQQDPKIDHAVQKYFPDRLNDIRLVDHKEIFEGYEEYLPTFNSICISNMLWRIKGLSNQFVYFNDDIFLLRPIQPSDWFRTQRPVLRGTWFFPPYERLMWDGIKKTLKRMVSPKSKMDLPASFQVNQWKAAALLGFRFRYFRSGHTPLALDKGSLESFFESHKEVLKKNISYRFRNYEQFNTVSLANHLEIKKGMTHFEPSQAVYMQPHNRGTEYVDKKFKACNSNSKNLFLCAQSLDLATPADQEKVIKGLQSLLQLNDE